MIDPQTKNAEVFGDIYECNFENEGFTVVSFSVPIQTRWKNGKYKISFMEDPERDELEDQFSKQRKKQCNETY